MRILIMRDPVPSVLPGAPAFQRAYLHICKSLKMAPYHCYGSKATSFKSFGYETSNISLYLLLKLLSFYVLSVTPAHQWCFHPARLILIFCNWEVRMTHFVGLIRTVISLNDNVQIKLPMHKRTLEVTASVKSL